MTISATQLDSADYQFTVDWFDLYVPVWREIIDREKPRKILEIGSFEGRSTCWVIEICTAASKADIEVVCIDTWGGGIEHQSGGTSETSMQDVEKRFDHNVLIARSKAPHNAKVSKVKAYSSDGLAGLIASGRTQEFDLIYIDGSHQAPDVLSDAVMAFHLLRVGGVMIFDDYLWSDQKPGTQDVLRMPKPAIDAFLNIFQRKMNIFQGAPNRQVYARKINP